MPLDSEHRALKDVAAHLPFDLDDSEAVGRVFGAWREHRRDADRETVELWTYCYVRRYFLQKFTRREDHPLADFDVLVEQAFTSAYGATHTVDQPARYANWVSAICRNTYINYLRSPASALPLHENADAFVPAEAAAPPPVDGRALRGAVLAAVGRLPEFLQHVARLRFLETQSYEEINLATGISLPVIRSYVSKAVARFRKDPLLLSAVEKASDNVSTS